VLEVIGKWWWGDDAPADKRLKWNLTRREEISNFGSEGEVLTSAIDDGNNERCF